jgi:glycine/D-amino acid oxidase-like deaminating enzyme
VLEELDVPSASLAGDALRARFPYLEADVGYIDLDGGVVNLPAVTAALQRALAERGVRIVQGITTRLATRRGSEIRVVTDAGEWAARSLVVTAGHGTNDVLADLDGALLQVPLTRDRPIEAKYFTPAAGLRDHFASAAMPVIAYLDAGIYCHPIVDGLIDKVKIGYYHPPDLPRATTTIDSVTSFVEHCLPALLDARIEPVDDVDGCDYDLVADDEFVLGAVPGFPGAYVGVGWRGTGYKFAPWVGRVLAELALERGTGYDVSRFDPARFTRGSLHAGPVVSANA